MRELTLPQPDLDGLSDDEVAAVVADAPTFQARMARIMADEDWSPEPFESALVDGELYWWHPAVEDPMANPDSDQPVRRGAWVLPSFTVPG